MRETPRHVMTVFLTCLMKVAEVQAQCQRPIVEGNVVMIDTSGQQTFPNGSTVTFKCSTGYTPVDFTASRTIICVGTEWTKLELNCTKKSCGSLPGFSNGKYTYPDGILFGATAIAQCNEGFLIIGPETRNCRDSGWDGRDPVCEAVKCSPPSTIQNGQFEPVEESYVYNQAVIYSCNGDYTLDGESTITCSKKGTFDPLPPKCILVECEDPNIPNAVRVHGKAPPYKYKNFVQYECKPGFTMIGSDYLVCEVKGWIPPPPVCITQCQRPIFEENVVMINASVQQTFPNGSTVTFKCSTGYTPVDFTASKTIACVGTEWTKLELNCTKKSCGSLPGFSNGKYTYPDGILFGATAIAQCNEGFLLAGEKTRRCQDGGWDGGEPVCEVNRVPAPTTTSPPSDSTCVKPGVVTIAAVVSIVVLLG